MVSDFRIPVAFGDISEAGPRDAVLAEGDLPGVTAHFTPGTGQVPGCACCATRGEAGRALAWLLHARARDQVPYFTRVLVVATTEAGRAEIRLALAQDPIASICYKN